MKANFPLRLPESIKRAAEQLAKEDGVSLNQFVAVAVAEKVGALKALGYLEERVRRADPQAFEAVLARLGQDEPPLPGDDIGDPAPPA